MHIVAGARVVKSQNSEVASAKRHKAGPQRLGCRDAEEQIHWDARKVVHTYFTLSFKYQEGTTTGLNPALIRHLSEQGEVRTCHNLVL